MKPLSIVFCGTSAFAVPSLKALALDKRFTVPLVITQPSRPVGRKQTLTPTPVHHAAKELTLPVREPESFGKEWASFHTQYSRPDFLVVVSYGQILPQEILDWPLIAAVNVHASLLPLLRGASPLQHAILQDMKETGVTIQKMVKELDAGPILAQRTHEMSERETFSSLHDALALKGATLLAETLTHPLDPKEQNPNLITKCGKIVKSFGIIDPQKMTAEEIDRMVRALNPWPSVTIDGKKILSSELSPHPEAMEIPCKNGTTLFVTQVQPSGGKPMNGQMYLRGHQNNA